MLPREERKPSWLKVTLAASPTLGEVRRTLRELRLTTVCEEARCPNRQECFGSGTATFMLLGDVCTRNCRFCAVKTGRPAPPDPDEPFRVAEGARRLGLRYVVLTSVARDDLPDGGAGHFAKTVRALKEAIPGVRVEVLVPDFGGDREALCTVLASGVDVFNHNVETVRRLTPSVRARATYDRSLSVLTAAKACAPHVPTKSGFMVGLGETREEIEELLRDLRNAQVDLLTIGQYLRPTPAQLPVVRYYSPEEFREIARKAYALGFTYVAAGSLVRSSYHAHVGYDATRERGFADVSFPPEG
ncbi:MAG: lipoyl synthase [Brockia lithotrophica]|nr:lipoyl synthase [Brockia lithotrophica]